MYVLCFWYFKSHIFMFIRISYSYIQFLQHYGNKQLCHVYMRKCFECVCWQINTFVLFSYLFCVFDSAFSFHYARFQSFWKCDRFQSLSKCARFQSLWKCARFQSLWKCARFQMARHTADSSLVTINVMFSWWTLLVLCSYCIDILLK